MGMEYIDIENKIKDLENKIKEYPQGMVVVKTFKEKNGRICNGEKMVKQKANT